MLTVTQSQSIEAASKYFETLQKGDYYSNGAELPGTWNGKAAGELGLEIGSEVTKEQFKAMLMARHPITGEKLAQRVRQDRRPGVDLTFSVPKSVSLAWAINQDEALLDALRDTVRETMTKDVEPLMARRVRQGKHASSMQRKATGKLVYADFLHKTSRPVNGKPDPQLHAHAFVLNYTTDEGRHYAAEMEEIFRRRPSLQAKFDARLARRLEQIEGYAVEKTRFLQSGRVKNGWELRGIERSTIEKFSNRTRKIEKLAAEKGITDAAEKATLGAKTREAKEQGASIAELRQEWRSRLTPEEVAAFEALRNRSGKKGEAISVEAAIDFALEHHLYRQSTVEKHQVVGTALEHALTLSPEEVEAGLRTDGVIQRSQGVRGFERDYVTTQAVLDAESEMIAFARDGRGTRKPIGAREHVFKRDWLNEEQKAAVRHVLGSRDTVTAVTGGAGTGKTSMMQEAGEAIEQSGKALSVFAPSTGAREVLQEKGFDNAQTVEHLIRNTKLHAEIKNQVIWIDEAGLLDVRSMKAIFRLAKEQSARIVLSGDSRQHSSPRRGEALKLLENHAGLHAARVDTIQRQKGQYKRAVELISLGHSIIEPRSGLTGLAAGFDLLDKLGKVKEINSEDRHAVLSDQYVEAGKRNRSTLVVAPTHAEGQELTDVIRERLRGAGAIGTVDREFSVLRSLNLSEAEKEESSSYQQVSTVVQFHQNVGGGYKRGERYRVVRRGEGGHALQPMRGGSLKPIPYNAPDRFEVYAEQTVAFAPGDQVRFTLGGKSADGRRISNGRIDQIKKIDRNGNLVLKSGAKIPSDYGHLAQGYVITSHASQGKDRDLAITAIGSQSLGAVNAKQFYVSVSRGREDCQIFVDDKAAVRRSIQGAGEQLSATELVHGQPSARIEEAAFERDRQRRTFLGRARDWWRDHFADRDPKASNQQAKTASPARHTTPELGRR